MVIYILREQVPARGVGEHKPVGVVPLRTGPELHLKLVAILRLERPHDRRGWGEGPGLAAFRCGEKGGFLSVEVGELLVNCDGAPLHVHAVPGEAQQLRNAHPGKQRHGDNVLQISPFCGGQQGGGLGIVQGLDFLLCLFRRGTLCGRIFRDVFQVNSLFQCRPQHLVDHTHGLRGQPIQPVDERLDRVGVELVKAHGSQNGLDVEPDIILINADRVIFGVAQIFPLPDVQPFPHGHLAGRGVGAPADLHGHGLHLLHNFLLRLAGKRALDLSACERVPACGDTGLPIGVLLSVAGVCALMNAPRSFCGSFRHDVLLSAG